jgi:two-component system cell cycle response regulator
MKILVIEDHAPQLKLAHQVLSTSGHDVSDAAAAEQALTAINADRPQLILLDLVLPGMDGLSLVRKLKADPGTRGIPVVAVTSYPEKYPEVAALAAGCDAYLLKPLNTRELSGQLTAVAETGRSQSRDQRKTP